MEGKTVSGSCFSQMGGSGACCRVEAVVSVDERGQMVLPKDLREKAGIRPGDKLAVIGWEKEGQICCFSIIKADALTDMVKGLLGPFLKDLMDQ